MATTAAPPRQNVFRPRSHTTAKLSVLASVIGFGSRQKRLQADSQPALRDAYNDERDVFIASPVSTTLLAPQSISPAAENGKKGAHHQSFINTHSQIDPSSSSPDHSLHKSNPLRPRSGGNSPAPFHHPGTLSDPPLSPREASGSLAFLRKRHDSNKATKTAALFPVGTDSQKRGSAQSQDPTNSRGSWHARSRSSIEMQLPKLATKPASAPDDFSSILEAVSNMGKPQLSPIAGQSSQKPDSLRARRPMTASAVLPGQSKSADGSSKTANLAPLITTLAPSQPNVIDTLEKGATVRGRSRASSAAEASLPAPASAPASHKSLRKLLPSLPPNYSLPPTPTPAEARTTSVPGARVSAPIPPPARPSTANSSEALAVKISHPPAHLSPITPSPVSGLLASSNESNKSSSRGTSAPSSPLAFAPVSAESLELADNAPLFGSTMRRMPSVRTDGARKENNAELVARPPPSREGNAGPSHSGFFPALRKSTSQSTLPTLSALNRARADSGTSTVAPSFSSLGALQASPRLEPLRLVRKQRSFHALGSANTIPPVPRQLVPPLPKASSSSNSVASSPTGGGSILSSWSRKRRSGSRGGDTEGHSSYFGLFGREDDSHSVKTLQTSPFKQKKSSHDGRTSPSAQSTFWDDSESPSRVSFPADVQQRRGSRPSLFALDRSATVRSALSQNSEAMVQHIVPPDELAAQWDRAPERPARPTESNAPAPDAPATGVQLQPGRGSVKLAQPDPAVAFVVNSTVKASVDVGFGGGLALAPMPPRRQKSVTTARGRVDSMQSIGALSAASFSRPSTAMSSIARSDSAQTVGPAAARANRPRALTAQTAQTAPAPPTRQHSVLRRPSFLDIEDSRAPAATGVLVPPTPDSASASDDSARMSSSFLDFGRMSMDTTFTIDDDNGSPRSDDDVYEHPLWGR